MLFYCHFLFLKLLFFLVELDIIVICIHFFVFLWNLIRAIECVHPRCPARRIKYTTRGRDVNAAVNIALSGASIVLAADRQPLPPFRRNDNHTRYNLVNELFSVVTPELVPRDFIRDEWIWWDLNFFFSFWLFYSICSLCLVLLQHAYEPHFSVSLPSCFTIFSRLTYFVCDACKNFFTFL